MLLEFSVSNFKGFEEEFTFDLTSKIYEFNKDSIKNNIINNALIYGHNGVGKSNLGIAIFDIITHITDKYRDPSQYQNFLNANSKEKYACFKYKFCFDETIIEYQYKKSGYEKLVYEQMSIDDNVVILLDREKNKISINLEGAETLNTNLDEMNISIIKYIKSNTVLKKNKINTVINQFFNFIDNMLLFWSLENRNFQGYATSGKSDILINIIENEHFQDFKKFLADIGVENNIKIISDSTGKKKIVFDFDEKEIDFFRNCSAGVRSLTLFYYWLQNIRFSDTPPSLIFIDEFDAFYHISLSENLVKELKKCNSQVILTTHNTSLISNKLLRPDCYYLMYKNSIKSLANSSDKELRQAHNIEKMYRAGAFNEQ